MSVAVMGIFRFFVCLLFILFNAKAYSSVYTIDTGGMSYIIGGGEAQLIGPSDTNQYNYDLVIPETIDGYPVTSIAAYAFQNKYVRSVQLPDNLKNIKKYAFHESGIQGDLIIPDGVTEIGVLAFQSNQISSVTFGGSVNSIGEASFRYNMVNYISFKGHYPGYFSYMAFDGNDTTLSRVFYCSVALNWSGKSVEGILGEPINNCDIDNDGYADIDDDFPLNPTEWLDTDEDGYGDNSDNCPMVYQINQYNVDGDSIGDACDPDNDNDGYLDINDAFPFNPREWIDSDNDGKGNNSDNCPFVYNTYQYNYDGDSMGNACDPDDDNDGYLDIFDDFPLDSTEWIDSDNDGYGDNSDNCPMVYQNNQQNTDGDSMGNSCDPDDDNDGYLDISDAFTLDPTEWLDTDSDGIGNNADTDDDDDGIADGNDAYPLNKLYSTDTDNDGMPDRWETVLQLNPNDSSDNVSDYDEDGVMALQEFIAGTLPITNKALDIDGNGNFDALTDGLIIIRYGFGLRGQMLFNDAISSDASRTDADIELYFTLLNLDIDGSGSFDALTDGLLVVRYAFGLRGDILTSGAFASGSRQEADIEAYIDSLVSGL